MNRPGMPSGSWSSLGPVLTVAVAYAVTAKISFLLTIPPGNISPVFPAAGLALGAVMVLGRVALVGVWLGSFAANTLSFVDGTVSSGPPRPLDLLVAALIALGALAGAGLGSRWVRRFCRDEHPLHSGRNVLVLALVGALGSCLLSPTVGVTGLALSGKLSWAQCGQAWVTWWVGDASGALVGAPLVLAWGLRQPVGQRAGSVPEIAGLLAVTVMVCLFVFFRDTPFHYALLPLVLWAAFRFGMRGAATSAAVITLFAVVGTSLGASPFVSATVNESLLLLNTFLAVTITCALFLAGLLEERRRIEAALRESEERLRLLGDNLPDSYVYQCTLKPDGTPQFLHLSAGVERLHGVPPQAVVRDAAVLLRQIDPETLPRFRAAEAACLATLTDFAMELRMCRADGQWRWMRLSSRPRRTGSGEVLWDGVVTDLTQRREAEEAIRQSEERFRLIAENLTDLVAVLDVEGRRLYNSPSYRTLLGDPGQLRGSSSFEQIHPEDRERVQSSFRRTVQTGIGERLEYRLVDLSGRVRYIESQGSVIRDAQGRVDKVLVVSRDVSERRQAEAARRESERKYRELVEHANSIILRWNSEGCITFLNEFGLRFFGYSAEEIFGRHVIGTIVPPSENGGRDLRRLMEEICANPVAFEQNTNENMRRSGERVWIAWANKVVRDASDQVIEILSVGTDVTDQRRADEQIRRLNDELQRHAAALEQRVAERTQELQALSLRQQALAEVELAINQPHELQAVLEQIVRLVARLLSASGGASVVLWEEGQQRFDLRATTVPCQPGREAAQRTPPPDSATRWIIDHRQPLLVGDLREPPPAAHPTAEEAALRAFAGFPMLTDSRVVGVLFVQSREPRAFTGDEREFLEAMAVRAAAAIDKVRMYGQLAEAKERAEAADRIKSAFLATMSHELRTPLNSIIGFTGILLQGLAGPLNPEQTKQLDMVRSSARHLLALINDVLDISKIEAGQLKVAWAPFDLAASIAKIIGVVTPLAERRNLALRMQLPPGLGQIVSDSRRVEQILLNLLNNAIKFTEQGEVRLEAVATDHAVRIAITDTGMGIKPPDLATLFQPFRQIDTGLSRSHEGTGLGLAICRRLADLLGGGIGVQSEWGKGSVFTLTLPRKPNATEDSPPGTLAVHGAPARAPHSSEPP